MYTSGLSQMKISIARSTRVRVMYLYDHFSEQ